MGSTPETLDSLNLTSSTQKNLLKNTLGVNSNKIHFFVISVSAADRLLCFKFIGHKI